MNKKEYEQQRRECWIECAFGDCNLGDASTPVTVIDTCKQVFDWTFDRAYALGKEKETITQEEIEKAAEKYDDKHTEQLIHDMDNDSTSWKPLQDGIRNAFKAGVNFALGKQEKDVGAVISGWVARDKDSNLFIYSDKPKRVYDGEFSRWEGMYLDTISNSLFPDLTWSDEPQEVEIILKRKKK